jgi:hypothetical protein
MDVAPDSSLKLAAINLKKAFIAIVIVKTTKKNMLADQSDSAARRCRSKMALTRIGMLFFEGQPGSKE